MSHDLSLARRVIGLARDLHGGEPAGEYTRGQVELICDVLGLPTDDWREIIEAAITTPDPMDIVTDALRVAFRNC